MLPPKPILVNVFTSEFNGISNVLKTHVKVSTSADPNAPKITTNDYIAIWDTGATNSVISSKVVKDLGLIPTGMVEIHGVHGSQLRPTFLVFVYLPNNVVVGDLQVTEGEFKDFDVLVGMDIINRGDFAVSNYQGKTRFTFRIPSIQHADFTPPRTNQPYVAPPKIGPNDPCPCGSKKKYKKCHGK